MIEYIDHKNLAPIVITTYNRPEHTKAMINSLLKNDLIDKSDVYFFCDNYKNITDKEKVHKTIQFINNASGFKLKKIIVRDKNLGMVTNTLTAINSICESHEKFIFLEDDAILSPYFLTFMNACLNYYKNVTKVMGVTGWKYPCGQLTSPDGIIFTRLAESWTWGTWRDRWKMYVRDDSVMSKFNKNMKYEFNFHNTNLFWRQLVGNKNKRSETWSIYWYAAFFLNNGLCAAPSETLAINTGNDGSGTHIEKNEIYNSKITKKTKFNFNDKIEEDLEYFNKLKVFFNSHKPSVLHRIKFRIKSDIRKYLQL